MLQPSRSSFAAITMATRMDSSDAAGLRTLALRGDGFKVNDLNRRLEHQLRFCFPVRPMLALVHFGGIRLKSDSPHSNLAFNGCSWLGWFDEVPCKTDVGDRGPDA